MILHEIPAVESDSLEQRIRSYFEFPASGFGFRALGFGFRVSGGGLRVEG
jgi:hypothetical protein